MSIYNQNSQNVNSQTNIGRDQIIHNLVVVGQLLDFTKIEGLIPHSSFPIDFSNLTGAVDEILNEKGIGNDLTQATAMAGGILSEVMLKWLPKNAIAALPAKTILKESPNLLYKRLLQMGFWKAFYSMSYVYFDTYSGSSDEFETEVIWLYSLQILQEKYFKEKELYGIAKVRLKEKIDGVPNGGFLCVIPSHWATDGIHRYEDAINTKTFAKDANFDEISYEKFRIIIAGLVLDLIRLCSVASDDIKFWQKLISLMKIDNNQNKSI